MSDAFFPNDSYTTSGSVQLYKVWTENVEKWDSDSFYNWEQDNIPLYDLEERTQLLWERLGYPTSSLPGMVLAVSADATPNDLECNPNLFTTVSAALEALPEIIRMPTIIEVASYGDLGEIELRGIKIKKGGSLEIINRCMVQVHQGRATTDSFFDPTGYKQVKQIESWEASAYFSDASAMSISTPITSAIYDPRLEEDNFIVFSLPAIDGTTGYRQNTLSVTPINSSPLLVDGSSFIRTDYDSKDLTSNFDLTVSTYDVSVYNEGDPTTELYRIGPNVTGTNAVQGLIYGNKCKKIVIKDCNGPIYLRGFAVDGTDQDDAWPQGRKVGIEVINSDLLLENMSVARCIEAGIRCINSKVIVTRGLVAYRNYELSSSSGRITAKNGAGLDLINSELVFSSVLDASGDFASAVGSDTLFSFQRNTVGIKMHNSTIRGGLTSSSLTANPQHTNWLTAAWNNTGIQAFDSIIDFDGRLDIFNNNRGIDLFGSKLQLDEITVEFSQMEGIRSRNSDIVYNKKPFKQTDYTVADSEDNGQFHCSGNGQHLYLINSTFKSNIIPSMPDYMGKMKFYKNHGTDGSDKPSTLPGLYFDHSDVELIHPKIITLVSDAEGYEQTYGVFGAAIRADNSTLKVRGSKTQACVIEGPDSYTDQTRTALVYLDGSKAEFSGPTVIAKAGVDILADNQSTLFLTPQRSSAGSYDASTWELSNTLNHTAIELHSTKACLVADHGSTIKMKDLGSYQALWPTATAVDVDYAFTTSAFHKAGSLQFYPNPIDQTIIIENQNDDFAGQAISDTFTQVQWPGGASGLYNLADVATTPPGDLLTYSRGGMCVRALNDSVIDAFNVHFPTGYDQTSGLVLDASADCGAIYIWNICDNSKLHAALLSVSGTYPSLAGYHGPSSVYASGAGIVCSGAPSGTPDTGMLSVLDEFASGVITFNPPDYAYDNTDDGNWDITYKQFSPATVASTTQQVGRSTWNNQGPFRIMVSIKPEARFLGNASAINNVPQTELKAGRIVWGVIPQIFAQGYSVSADASAFTTVSSVYTNLVKAFGNTVPATDITHFDTSGFYYQDEFVEDTYKNIILDESAANTFANAKNGSLGTSRRAKLCSIYQADSQLGGEAYDTNVRNGYTAVGFKSVNVFDLTREL